MSKTLEHFLFENNVPILKDIEDLVWSDGLFGLSQTIQVLDLMIGYLKGKKLNTPIIQKFDAVPTIITGTFSYDPILFDEDGQPVNGVDENYLLLDYDGNLQFDENKLVVERADESTKNKHKVVRIKTKHRYIQNSFFLGTRAVFGKKPRLAFTNDDIDEAYTSSDQLNGRLHEIFEPLKALGIKNRILVGDVLFTKSQLEEEKINDEDNIIFRSNTILYGVPKSNAELYDRIKKAELGIHFYGSYNGNFRWVAVRDKESNRIKSVRLSSDWLTMTQSVDLSGIKETDDVFFDSEQLKSLKGKHDRKKVNDRTIIEIENIDRRIKDAYNELKGNSDFNKLFSNDEFKEVIANYSRYTANRATGANITDSMSIDTLLKFVVSGTRRKIGSSKKIETKQKKLAGGKTLIQFIKENKRIIQQMFIIMREIENLKTIVLTALEKSRIDINAFIKTNNGLVFQTLPAHYIVPTSPSTAVRLSDRSAFTNYVETEMGNDTHYKDAIRKIDEL